MRTIKKFTGLVYASAEATSSSAYTYFITPQDILDAIATANGDNITVAQIIAMSTAGAEAGQNLEFSFNIKNNAEVSSNYIIGLLPYNGTYLLMEENLISGRDYLFVDGSTLTSPRLLATYAIASTWQYTYMSILYYVE